MKNKIILAFCLLISILTFEVSLRMLLKNKQMGQKIIKSGLPAIEIVSKNGEKTTFNSYLEVLKSKFVKNDVFIELPEDRVELEPINIVEEKIVEEKEDPIAEDLTKEVTLDWSKMLRNETKFNVDVAGLVSSKLGFGLKKKETEVIIYHTHTTEAYTPENDNKYTSSGAYRTTDSNANVTRIGRKLEEDFIRKGIKVFHDETIYDGTYNLSYSKAGKGITANAKKFSKANIVLDVHRDALQSGNSVYRPTIKINGKNYAQILLVVGTNQGGLKHSGWKENLKFALKIKAKADEKYPGLCRYVVLRKERFNQQVAKGAIIVEMGATGNSIDEVLASSEMFVDIVAEVAS